MPVHNGGRWLRETLASAAAQDCLGIEFLLIDSSDDETCERITAEFRPLLDIRYQRRPDITLWTAKTNLAAHQARAPHCAMLHQDDLWLPDRVADMRAAIAASPGAALLLNPSYIIDQHSRRLGLWRCPLPAGRWLSASQLAERLLVQNFVAIPAPVIRREAWLAAGGMDETLWYTADWDLYLKVARHGSTVYRTAATTAFRVHSGSLTVTGSANAKDFISQMNRVIEQHLDLAPVASRDSVHKRAVTSVKVNCALAEGLAGRLGLLPNALLSLLGLGPIGLVRYFRDSRIIERVAPRLRARLARVF